MPTTVKRGPVLVIDRGFLQIQKNLSKIGKTALAVGVQGASASKADDDGVTNLNKAIWNEFGTDDGHVPERSFIRSTVRKNQKKYVKMNKKLGEKLFNKGKVDPDRQLGVLGEVVRADIVKTINDGVSPANNQRTLDRKGSSTPLVDSGDLKRSISWDIV